MKIRFIDGHYKDLFTIEDGESIKLVNAFGEEFIKECKYLDDFHTRVGSRTYHICEFAQIMNGSGTTYAPITQ